MAISRLATPSSPVTAGVRPVRMASTKAEQLGAQRLGIADRQMPHRIAAVGLEAEAFGDLQRQQIADEIFVAGGDVDGARLERRQPVGVDVREHARGGAELQQRDVLALGDRARSCGWISTISESVNQRIRSMSCTARSMTTPTFDMRGGNGPTRVMAIERMSWSLIARLIDSTAGLKRSTWPTISVTPARRAAATMARPSSTVGAIGFSTRTWMPRAMQCEREVVMQMRRRRDGHRIDQMFSSFNPVAPGVSAHGAMARIQMVSAQMSYAM